MGFLGALLVADSIDKHRWSVEENSRAVKEQKVKEQNYAANQIDYDELATAIVRAQRMAEEEHLERQRQQRAAMCGSGYGDWIVKCGASGLTVNHAFPTKEAAIKAAMSSLKSWGTVEVVYSPEFDKASCVSVWRS
jgi:hypothetical protein